MLDLASRRGYRTIHKPIEEALSDIPDNSYDFVFALSSLQFVKDINETLSHIERIVRKTILLSLDEITEEYSHEFCVQTYDHSRVVIPNAKEDYTIRGWTSPTTGITIRTRMIYIEK